MKTALLTIVWADDREICIAGEIFWLTKIVRANWEKVKEEKQMCEALQELFADELKESMEYGEQRKLVSQVCIKLKKAYRGSGNRRYPGRVRGEDPAYL